AGGLCARHRSPCNWIDARVHNRAHRLQLSAVPRTARPERAQRKQIGPMIETIQWTPEGVVMIDQTKIPAEETYVTCADSHQVAEAIRSMVIRGAPAIGVAAAMGVAIGVEKADR